MYGRLEDKESIEDISHYINPHVLKNGYFLHHDGNQNAFVRESVADHFKINGQKFSDYDAYKALGDEKYLVSQYQPLLTHFVRDELFHGDIQQAEATVNALGWFYTQELNSHVIKAISSIIYPLQVCSDYEVNLTLDRDGQICLTTIFDIKGFGMPPMNGGDSSELVITKPLNATITQQVVLDNLMGIRPEKLYCDNALLKKIYLEAIACEKAIKKAATLQSEINPWASDKSQVNLLNKANDVFSNIQVDLGTAHNRYSLFKSIVKYIEKIIKNPNQYHSGYINDFDIVLEAIYKANLEDNEKNHLLWLLDAFNYEKLLQEANALDSVLQNLSPPNKESLEALSKDIVTTACQIMSDEKMVSDAQRKDMVFYTKILHNTKTIIKAVHVASENSSSINQTPLPEENLIKEYHQDALTLKQSTSSLSRTLGDAMIRLEGAALILLSSFSMAFSSLAASFNAPNSLNAEVYASAEKLAQIGHAKLFKPRPKKQIKDPCKDKVSKAMFSYMKQTKC